MFEFLRERIKSTAVKRQETLNAYLDGELAPQDRVAFERLLADDALLRQELADRELIKSQLRQLPRVTVPRNFILDANKYRKPAKQPLITYYPVLRGATALMAVLFIFTLGWGMMGSGESYNAAPVQEAAMEVMVETAVEEAESIEEEVVAEAEMPEMEAVPMESVPMERIPADGIVEAEESLAAPAAETVEDIFEEVAEEMAGEEASNAIAEEGVDEAFDDEVTLDAGADLDMADDMGKSADGEEGVGIIETAVSPAIPQIQPEPTPSPALTSTQIAQLGLFILFIALLALSLYARRQR